MSVIRHLLQPKPRDIGFPVRRLLPSALAPAVGPFVFLDHMGPFVFPDEGTLYDVRPHPHIGLATVTYLFSGAMMHRDSLGSEQRIEPRAVNWMTAGRGIVHSERIPADIRAQGTVVEGIQMWVALPLPEEEAEPGFWHHPAASLPLLERDGAQVHLLAGTAYGASSPVHTYSRTLYAAIELPPGAHLDLPLEPAERAIYVAQGRLELEDTVLEAGQLTILEPGGRADLRGLEAARLMLLGGEPLDAPRHLWWNFVSSSRARIEAAKQAWREDRFTAVPGEHERIPLPEH